MGKGGDMFTKKTENNEVECVASQTSVDLAVGKRMVV